ncbi:LPS export ABC transporter periplasmic protein LptC [Aggregatibacter actinomycetemcomitans]|uniref:LPS export ABC transporter periplasmic protein LptC n=1 Tax=Aggregatibacter actinomycetemcomitans TaxID=714 RepID=UPI00197C5123|nr:LPS export ABC transporter periplasmic protein LptC [Aggregatibacter actinomycetemcomitans]MBN6064249.1 LPS export ABC transporter periplasmic protein LptC [Aggregatibacter actinomycetemcomitans]MBN6076585.1 LPS export ABC transporter periplasmic protein LptC [Aggregatibacter actinomycetemcomitans]MBN6081695.1 LPS export ABC transporter periplasmic protein LptC [Aggregatibacter actinomycetemcomitans]MBN6084092.1 LPS export ABC transporter periplasmic protein LptC [Aggregatibacter actinomycet
MNIRLNIILAVIALGLLAWFYSLNQEDGSLKDLIKTVDSPEYVGQKMSTTVYSPTGKKQYLAISAKVEHYTSDGHTDFQQPVVLLLDIEIQNTDKESWKLSADKARLTKDNMLYLDGNVIAQSLSAQSRLQRIETQSAVVNLTTQDISSDQMVKLNGQNFNSTGLKLTGNLQQQVATLKEQVKTYYEISKQ